MDIGLKLKELRILKGLTQEELADRAELSKGFISQIERNLTSRRISSQKPRMNRSCSEKPTILKKLIQT